MNAVDTNVLVYAFDQAEPAKRPVALALLERLVPAETILLWQVFVETGSNLTKLAVQSPQFDAWTALQGIMARQQLVVPTMRVATLAWELQPRYQLSYWDSFIIAGCIDAGVTTLYTEDTQSRPEIEGVKLINPFAS